MVDQRTSGDRRQSVPREHESVRPARDDDDLRRARMEQRGEFEESAAIVRQGRRAAGLDVAHAAAVLKVAPEELMKWESGASVPTRLEVLCIARFWRLPAKQRHKLQVISDNFWVGWPPTGEASERDQGDEGAAPMKGVFISYRRTDDPGFAGRLYDRLEAKFGNDGIFMDVDSIELGVDFVEELGKALARCAVLIAVIGPRWLTATGPSGRRRLDDPDDFVRLEIERALDRNIRVIPVLVDGTPMPKIQDLPGSLAPLVRRYGHPMANARFGSDSLELIRTLERILDEAGNRTVRVPAR